MNKVSGDDQWVRFASSLRVELVERARFLEVDVQVSRKGLGVTVELAKHGSSAVLFAFCDGSSIDVWLPGSWEWRWQDAVENFPELDGAVPEVLVLLASTLILDQGVVVGSRGRQKFRVEIEGGRFVEFGKRGRWGLVSSSNIV